MVRPATIYDLPFALSCWAAQGAPDGLDLKAELARATQRFCQVVSGDQLGVALIAGPARGFAVWAASANPTVWVDHGIYVMPEERRQGVATALLRRLEGEAKRLGAQRLVATPSATNEASLRFFQKVGWRSVQITYLKELS